MGEGRNTIVCTFDSGSPRISALEIHEWVRAVLRIPEQKVNMIQIDGIKRQVYTGCNRRNGPDFGRVFLKSNYTDITQNTYIQS